MVTDEYGRIMWTDQKFAKLPGVSEVEGVDGREFEESSLRSMVQEAK